MIMYKHKFCEENEMIELEMTIKFVTFFQTKITLAFTLWLAAFNTDNQTDR